METLDAEQLQALDANRLELINLVELNIPSLPLYLSDRTIEISGVEYEDYIHSINGIGADFNRDTGESTNSDIDIVFRNLRFRSYSHLIEASSSFPFDGVGVTVKEVYLYDSTAVTTPRTIFIGELEEARDINLLEFRCKATSRFDALANKYKQYQITKDVYASANPKDVGKYTNVIYGSATGVVCHAIDAGSDDTIAEDIKSHLGVMTGTPIGAGSESHLKIIGNYAYITGDGVFTIVDITDPTELATVGSIVDSRLAGCGDFDIDSSGDYAYLISGSTEIDALFMILDVQTKTAPFIKGEVTLRAFPGPSGCCAIYNSTYVIATAQLGFGSSAVNCDMYTINVTSKTAPVISKTTSLASGPPPRHMIISANYFYLTRSSPLFTYSHFEAYYSTAPQTTITYKDSLVEYTVYRGMDGFCKYGNYCYVACSVGNSVVKINVTTPTALSITTTSTASISSPFDIAVNSGGTLLYIAQGNSSIVETNMSFSVQSTMTNTNYLGGCHGVAWFSADYLFASAGNSALLNTIWLGIDSANLVFSNATEQGMPTGIFTVKIEEEEITLSAGSGNTRTISARGANSTYISYHRKGVVVFEIQSEYIYLIANHPVKAISAVYIDKVRQEASTYTAYTGQTGDSHASYTGKAVIKFTERPGRKKVPALSASQVISEHYHDFEIGLVIIADVDGYQDDGSGTYTGTPNKLIQNASDVLHHFLAVQLGATSFNTASFSTARTDFANLITAEYTLEFVIDKGINIKNFIEALVFQSRCSLVDDPVDGFTIDVIPTTAPAGIKTIGSGELVGMGAQFTFNKTPTNEIFNDITLRYKQTYNRETRETQWQGTVVLSDSTSQTKFGVRSLTFDLFAVRDDEQASDLAQYLLYKKAYPLLYVDFEVFWHYFGLQRGDTIVITNGIFSGKKFYIEFLGRRGKDVLPVRAIEWWT